ncbi:MAG: beta-ketoacyl synthase N-terminal-like domain-containing protein, partial [Planctomycetota bacterium]
VVGWLPPHHDMGLIGNVLHPLYLGASLTLMKPIDFLQSPVRWLRALADFGGTISGGPSFAYRLCIDEIDDADLDGLDLSQWQVAFNGAEPIDADVIDAFSDRFKSVGFDRQAFCPCYGMAETTLLVTSTTRMRGVTCHKREQDEGTRRVSCGSAHQEMDVRIVDPETCREVEDGVEGEIWVHGPSVASGYFGNPDATRETFDAILADGPDTNSRRYLRTGDLGYWLNVGEANRSNEDRTANRQLFVSGRLKDLIISSGVNHYPQDIEATVQQSHASVQPGGVAAFEIEPGQLGLLVELRRTHRRDVDANALINVIVDCVAEHHQLSVSSLVLVRPGTVPKTTSGKLQRGRARRLLVEGNLKAISSLESLETKSASEVRGSQPLLSQSKRTDVDQLIVWIRDTLASKLGVASKTLDTNEPFSRLGLKSIQAVRLSGQLAEHLGRPVPATLAYEYPTIEKLAMHLSGAETMLIVSKTHPEKANYQTPIAVIGIGCRVPGANDWRTLWRNLLSGDCQIGPLCERDTKRPWAKASEHQWAHSAGWISDIDQFDAGLFGISPREADVMDPQHRVLLETTWRAFEDARLPIDRYAGSAVGVFVGSGSQDYARLCSDAGVDAYTASGNSAAMASNRISYVFDFAGPSLTIDTACSSSLVAVHHAMTSLHSGQSDLAVVGGVHLMLSPDAGDSFHAANMLSPSGTCRVFDDAADGFVRGEGCGVVLLKRLDDAVADGNSIIAVLAGSAVNQDGRSNGLTAPSREAQTRLIHQAIANANVDPNSIGYVEAHGTGTSLGDPIEVRGLLEAFLGDDNESMPARVTPLRVGSVKANLGHLEAAAGIAGLIKSCLMVKNGTIPGQVNFETANAAVDWPTELEVATQTTAWTSDGPRTAGVSSFGFGGTNAHVIVQQPPSTAAGVTEHAKLRSTTVWLLSAKTTESLNQSIAELFKIADQYAAIDIAATLATTRMHFNVRAALIVPLDHAFSIEDAKWLRSDDKLPSTESQSDDFGLPLAISYLGGKSIDVDAAFPVGRRDLILPGYAMQRASHWVKPTAANSDVDHKDGSSKRGSGIPDTLPGQLLHLATRERVWECRLTDRGLWSDHRVGEACVFPAAGYVSWIVATIDDPTLTSMEIEFDLPLTLSAAPVCCHLLHDDAAGKVSSSNDDSWQTHATFTLHPAELDEATSWSWPKAMETRVIDVDAHYEQLARNGLAYVGVFRAIESIEVAGSMARGIVSLAGRASQDAPLVVSTGLHPALLDAGFQMVAAAGQFWGGSVWLPQSIERFQLFSNEIPNELRVELCLSETITGSTACAKLRFLTLDGNLVATVSRLTLSKATSQAKPNLLTQAVWSPQIRIAEPVDAAGSIEPAKLRCSLPASRGRRIADRFNDLERLAANLATEVLRELQWK